MTVFGKVATAVAGVALLMAPAVAQAADSSRASSAAKLSVSAAVAAPQDNERDGDAYRRGGYVGNRTPWLLIGLGAAAAIILAIIIASHQQDEVISP
jgi:hypothetical protein